MMNFAWEYFSQNQLFNIVTDSFKKILDGTASESIVNIMKMLKKMSPEDAAKLKIKDVQNPIGNGMVSLVFDSTIPDHVVKITAVGIDDNVVNKVNELSVFPSIKKKTKIKHGPNEFDVLISKKLQELPEDEINFIDKLKSHWEEEKQEDQMNSVIDWIKSQKRLAMLKNLMMSGKFSEKESQTINNIISLIDKLHSKNISFNDFKGSQFMLDPDTGEIKLVDYGSVRDCEGFNIQSFFG